MGGVLIEGPPAAGDHGDDGAEVTDEHEPPLLHRQLQGAYEHLRLLRGEVLDLFLELGVGAGAGSLSIAAHSRTVARGRRRRATLPAMAILCRDDMGRELLLPHPPRRVVSLVPSDTDSLFALGVGDRVVGRTRYCVEPAAGVDDLPICGGTKDIDVAAVRALAPDLVLANQEENSRAPLEELARAGVRVLVSFPRRVADGIAHLARLARIFERGDDPGVRSLMRDGYRLLEEAPPAAGLRAFVPIWMDPLMTFSAGAFGDDVLRCCGVENAFADRHRKYPLAADLGRREPLSPDRAAGRDTRYPRVTLEEVVARRPDLVLLPDEPHAFSAADADVFRQLPIPAAPDRVVFCDGKDLFWYGARSIAGVPRLRAQLSELRAS